MKYYSEVLKKVFDTPEALNEAEAESKRAEVKKAESRKALAARVEQAQSNIDKAYECYDNALEEVQKILDESNAKAEKLLNAAKEDIKRAESEKLEAIRKFNEKFGPYTTTYTGDKAKHEFDKLVNRLEDAFPLFWF